MKRIHLIEETSPTYSRDKEPIEWEADRVDYISCIRQCMRRPLNPREGADYDEMQKALRVLTRLDGLKLGDWLELEDEDHKNLAERARTQKWPVNDERIVRFTKAVIDAQERPVGYKEDSDAPPGRMDSDRIPV